jgi:hypothetical protein
MNCHILFLHKTLYFWYMELCDSYAYILQV